MRLPRINRPFTTENSAAIGEYDCRLAVRDFLSGQPDCNLLACVTIFLVSSDFLQSLLRSWQVLQDYIDESISFMLQELVCL